jgi:hypothetical protein
VIRIKTAIKWAAYASGYYEGEKMPNSWDDLTLEEKVDRLRAETERLRTEMMHKDNQIAGLQLTVNEIGDAVKRLEEIR